MTDRLVVLFDGECNLCSGVVRFIAPRDRAGRVAFASLQSPAATVLLRGQASPDSIVVIDGGEQLVESDAVLRLAAALPFPWRLIRAARLLPRPARDGLYRLVARNRARWFGRADTCLVPDATLRERFLADGW